MIIKKEVKRKKNRFFSFTTFLYFYFFISIFAGSILVIAFFQSQFFIQKKDTFLDIFSKAGRYEYLYLPQIVFKAFKSNFYKLEKLDLEIPFEKSIILENLRKESLSNGYLPPSDKMPKIKTKIIYNENEFDADIRLKGDRAVHYNDKEKSSYKLELDRNQYLFGIKKFSLQKPRVRNYVHEWIFHKLSAEQDIIKIKYEFINLSVNGEDKGLYVIEEGFGKELIERNKRRNGPIFSIDEDIYQHYDKPVFEIYNKKFWQKPENNLIANVASQKLHDFIDNKLTIQDVFDLEKWASYFAVIDLTATYHGAMLKSVKLYYNPLNGLFEPIPFDGHRLKPNYHKYNRGYDNRILIDIVQNPIGDEINAFSWLKRFFYKNGELNKKFYNLYSSSLNRISSEKYINEFLSENLQKIEEINTHIYADYFFYDNSRSYGIGLYYFLLSDFKYHAQNIRKKLRIKNEVQLLKIDQNKYLFKPLYKKNYNQLIAKKLLCSRQGNEIELVLNQELINFNNTLIQLRNLNTDGLKCKSIALYDKFTKKTIFLKVDHLNSEYSYDNFKKEYVKRYEDFFNIKEKILTLKDDVVEIDTNIYIPEGYKIIINPGQKIFLTNKAFIISNSPWQIGGKDQSVVISGKKDNLGGGILIGDTEEISKIENTKFSYLGGYNFEKNFEYIILGSINFHQTKVQIKKASFEKIFSEDAINIFRSNFNIYDVKYNAIYSDAIDIDFSDGNIEKGHFANIENDAIDFSGSNVNINDVYFDNVNDKIISAGEDSIVSLNKIEGINSYAGIISKDGSKVISSNVIFDGVKIPFASYQKKNEYLHPSLEVKNYRIKNFLTKPIKDVTANLVIDDKILVLNSSKVISLMYEKNLSLIE